MFNSVVFAGGGCRCIWQVGFWEVISPELNIKPKVVAAVSGGAVMAAITMTGTSVKGFNSIKTAIEHNRKNFYYSNILKKRRPFPHYRMYRNAIVATLDHNALKSLENGPEVRIGVAHPPSYLGARSGLFVGAISHIIEDRLKYPIHLVSGKKLGYTVTISKLNDCTTPDEAADLIMCSSCIQPLIPTHKFNGKTAIDGGVYDNVPVYALGKYADKGNMLILLTRKFDPRRIPKIPGRLYVQPSEDPPVKMWDYTDPAGFQMAYDLGRKDGEAFIKLYSKNNN